MCVCVCTCVCGLKEMRHAFWWREGTVYLGGNFPGENFLGGIFLGSSFLSDNFLGDNLPMGNVARILLKASFFTWTSIVRTLFFFFFFQNVEVLLFYAKLFNEFFPSLKNVQDLLRYFPDDLKSKVETKLNNVTKEWENLQNEMVQIIKVINSIQIVSQFFLLMFNLYWSVNWFTINFSKTQNSGKVLVTKPWTGLQILNVTKNGLTLVCMKWVPRDPSTIFLTTSFI